MFQEPLTWNHDFGILPLPIFISPPRTIAAWSNNLTFELGARWTFPLESGSDAVRNPTLDLSISNYLSQRIKHLFDHHQTDKSISRLEIFLRDELINGIFSLISSLGSTAFQMTPLPPSSQHRNSHSSNSSISLTRMLSKHFMFICLNYWRFVHFCLLQKNAEISSCNVRCLFLDVTDHEKKRRKRKRKKQILIAELYESPIQGNSISQLPLAD
jgi:hypothetical protein